MQNALARSLNLPPVRILNSYGCTKSFKFLTEKVGITTLVESETKNGKKYSDIGLSQLALGGVTYGVNTPEWTAAYAIFGNGGMYYEPTFYSKITSNDGKEVYLEKKTEGVRAISEETAYIMNRMLKTAVDSSQGTGKAAKIDGLDVCGKTGTSQVRNISKTEREKGVLTNEELKWHMRNHGLFGGYAPLDNPKYVVCVVTEHSGSSSPAARTAATVMRELLKRI